MIDKLQKINDWYQQGRPFFVLISYDKQQVWVGTAEEAAAENILFDFPQKRNFDVNNNTNTKQKIEITKEPISLNSFSKGYNYIQAQIQYGNTFLCNYTLSTPITCNVNLATIFNTAKAKYKVLYKNEFVCFSPEIFVQINDGNIYTYPMKGTIDAALPHAAQQLLQNEKEKAEHYTIVDLMRADLARVATNVQVQQFRYLDHLSTSNKNLYQASSKISAALPTDFLLGNALWQLLPAGSISGAPKPKTIEIINAAEEHKRGYYTGIAGYFNGHTFDSCVLIRFIENTSNGLVYKSGGGITCNSNMEEEYKEVQDKIYIAL
jgi:para-aminobenzoate synthetase component I